jgi:hypothetical protein
MNFVLDKEKIIEPIQINIKVKSCEEEKGS